MTENRFNPKIGFAFMVICSAAAFLIVSYASPRFAGGVFAGATGLVLAAVAGLFYLLPTVVAGVRNHRQIAPIAVINIFLGWTGVGWVGALAWSVAEFDKR